MARKCYAVIERELPAAWASYLISGERDADSSMADVYLASQGLPCPVEARESGIGYFLGVQCELATYIFLK